MSSLDSAIDAAAAVGSTLSKTTGVGVALAPAITVSVPVSLILLADAKKPPLEAHDTNGLFNF
jgi:hypothetical protein